MSFPEQGPKIEIDSKEWWEKVEEMRKARLITWEQINAILEKYRKEQEEKAEKLRKLEEQKRSQA
jgi:hypothetical protein